MGLFGIMVVGYGKGKPSLRCLADFDECAATTGLKQCLNKPLGSSKEYWAMYASTTQ